MRSLLLWFGLLFLLAEFTTGQWGGDVYFPDYDSDEEDDYGGNSRQWPPRPQQPNSYGRPNMQPSPMKRPQSTGTSSAQNSGSLPMEDCGTTHGKRIRGGEIAGLGQFPWSALLQYSSGRSLSFECGGSLISKRYVLTAAHCLHRNVIRNYRLVGVRLGEHDTTTTEDCDGRPGSNDRSCSDPPIDFGVERQIMHPQYTGRPESTYDIGLVRLNRDAPTTDYIRPICLPTEENARTVGGNLIVSGWGITEPGGPKSPQLRFVAVPFMDTRTCSTRLNKNIDSSQICAGGVRGEDSCKGDSGGPLIDTGRINGDNRYIVKGVVSFGPIICGTENKPGVYTRVASFTDWITRTINS